MVVELGDNNGNITPEQLRALEAAQEEGKAVINGDKPAAERSGMDKIRYSTQDQASKSNDPAYNKSEKEKQHAQLVAMVQMGIDEEIAKNHINFVENGFRGDQDLNTFVSNLDDKKYQNYLDENPEEKRKVFDNVITAKKEGKISDKSWANAMENPYFRKEIEDRGLDKALGNTEQEVSQVKTAEEKQALADKYNIRFEELDKIVAPLRAATKAGSIVKQDVDVERGSSSYDAKDEKEALSKDTAIVKVEKDNDIGLNNDALSFLDDDDKKADFEKTANSLQNSTQTDTLAEAKNPSQEIPKPQKSDSVDIDRMG